MMSSFGQWYEQQKTAAAGGDLESGGGGNSVMMIPLFSKSSASNGSGTATTNADLNSSSSGMGGLGRLETMGANVGGSFSALKSSFDAQFPSRVCGMTYPERFRMFCALLLLSTLFFTLALTVGISLIYARPQKFAICFTCGSLTFMSSFAVLRGPMDHIRGMLAPDRLLFTSIYVGSMAATLHFTFRKGGVRGYIYVLSCSALQIVALLWYLISFVPGGSAGLQVLVGAMIRMLRPILLGCIKMWSRLLRSLVGWLSR